jgi:hypothetical protein
MGAGIAQFAAQAGDLAGARLLPRAADSKGPSHG